MKIETSELAGDALDWAVRRALRPDLEWKRPSDGLFVRWPGKLLGVIPKDWQRFTPSTAWVQGGPIIEREGISLYKVPQPDLYNEWKDQPPWPTQWEARCGMHKAIGPTPLIAAMRAYVESKVGERVEIPDELLREA